MIEEGRPFTIRLVDGRSYPVTHRDYVSLPPKNATVAVVYEDDGTVHVLPLLTMKGLTYRMGKKIHLKLRIGTMRLAMARRVPTQRRGGKMRVAQRKGFAAPNHAGLFIPSLRDPLPPALRLCI